MSSGTWQIEATGNVKLALLFGVALNGDADIVLSSNGLPPASGLRVRATGSPPTA